MKFHNQNIRSPYYSFLKRFLDIVVSILLIIILSPIFGIIAFLIKLNTRGPIIFLHKRVGKNNKSFLCAKFRTMHPESKYILEKLVSQNEKIKEEYFKNFKIINDPRITNIGKILRFTSLDELPQLFNVLRGEMSLIGPRPITDDEIKKYGSSFQEVFSIRPGMTGLWQVSGRNKLSYKRRVMLDLIYVKTFNPIMDIRILLRTVGVILFPFDRGAS